MQERRFAGFAWKSEQGVSLVLALVALAFGVLLVTPMLSHVSTNLSASQVVDQNMREQYTSDAGVEYGLWKLKNVPEFRDQVRAAGRTGVTITLPSRVNSLDPVVRVALAGQELKYALWGNGTTCDSNIEWTGSGNAVNGDLHTNTGLRVMGHGNILNGTVEYVTDIQVHGSTIYVPPPPDNPVPSDVGIMPAEWYMSDYDDPTAVGTPAHTADLLGDYHSIVGNFGVDASGYVFHGLYYVTGDIHLKGNNLSGNVTFVAGGLIKLNGTDNAFTPYCDRLTFFTDFAAPNQRCGKPVISIIGSGNCSLNGVVYAPNGQISVRGSGAMGGSLLGDSIDLAGSNLSINLPDPLGGHPVECTAYDVLSEAGEWSTLARVVCCDDELYVRSWWIQ